MKFDEFEAEDLLLEESFRNYCLGANDTDVAFWEHWIAAHPARQPVVQQARELYFLLNGNITPAQIREDEKHFLSKLQQHTGAKRKPVRRMIYYAAASVVLLVLALVFFNKQPVTTQVSETKKLDLPDGSKVTLLAGSSVKVSGRELALEGEAFFEVAHDAGRPFIVHTRAMDIKVLGTVFNVRATDSATETHLVEGSVEVTLHNDTREKIILRPQETIVFVERSNTYQVSSNKNKLDFKNEAFSSIAATLERVYNVKLVFKDSAIAGYRYTGVFEQKSVEQVLKALQLSRPFAYTIDTNKVIHISK